MSYEKLYQISFAICTLFALTMFSSNLETIQRVYSAKNEAKVHTGVLETKEDRKENLSKTIQTIGNEIIPSANASVTDVEENGKQKVGVIQSNTQQKSVENVVSSKNRTPKQIYDQVKHLGYREEPTISLISTCKASSLRPDHCILVGLTLMYNEAGNQQNSKACVNRNNCFGIQSGKKSYSSLDEGMENFVQKYNKWWINVKSAEDFYPDLGKLSKTRYCYSEIQYHPNIGCPDGQKIAKSKWNQLEKIIYLN